MYSIYDYAYNGLLYLNNVMRPRHKWLSQLMIYSTTLCQSKCKHCNIWQKRPVGNIHEQSLDEIFNGASTCQTQCRYSRHCNECWINFHRKYDIILVRNFERLLPKWLVEKFYGPYQWTADPKQTYRNHLKAIQ